MAGSGFIVMLPVPRDVADVIAPPDGEDVTTLHITLAYMGNGEALPPGSFDAVANAVEGVCASSAALEGTIGGIGRFNASDSSDGMDVVYASYDCPTLAEFRQAIVAAVEAAGVPVKRNHGFCPHVTLKYVYPFDDSPMPKVPTTNLNIGEVVVAMAGETRRLPIGRIAPDSEAEPEAAPPELDEPSLMALRMMGFNVVEKEDAGDDGKPVQCKVLKADAERRLVYGIVLRPLELDTQGHVMSMTDVEYAAHHYVASNGIMAIRHKEPADAVCVESYIAPIDFEVNGQRVLAGDWVLVSYVRSDSLWNRILAGDYQGYSVGGFGNMASLQ